MVGKGGNVELLKKYIATGMLRSLPCHIHCSQREGVGRITVWR